MLLKLDLLGKKMKSNLITENYMDDFHSIKMDEADELHQIRLLLSKHESILLESPIKNYPYRTMDVFDDLPF